MLRVRHSFYIAVSGFIFLLVGIGHALRAFYEWEMVINGWMVPVWISWLAVLIAFVMALAAVKFLK